MKTKAVLTFKVYPCKSHGNDYWEVRVFKNRKDMKSEYKKISLMEDKDNNVGAVVIPMRIFSFKEGKEIVSPKLGYVLFSENQLGAETISHEALHMATNYFRLIDKPGVLNLQEECDEEEFLAYAVGGCAQQIVTNLHKLEKY